MCGVWRVSLGNWGNHEGETWSRPWEKRGARAYMEGETGEAKTKKLAQLFSVFLWSIYGNWIQNLLRDSLLLCSKLVTYVHAHTHTHTHTRLKFQECLPLNLCLCSYQQVIDTLFSVHVNQAITWWDFLVGKMLQMLCSDKAKVFPRISCCSIAMSCLTLCDPKDCSMPCDPVLHHL